MTAPTTIIVLASIAVLNWFAQTTHGCGGNKLQIEYIRNCDSNNVIELSDDFNVVLKDNCEVHFHGCVTMHANVTSSQIDYTVEKDAFKRSAKKDGCGQLEKIPNDVEIMVNLLGLPNNCPINKGTICLTNKTLNVNKYKLRMNILVGNLKGKVLITTNEGKSCMEFAAKMTNSLVKSVGQLGMMG